MTSTRPSLRVTEECLVRDTLIGAATEKDPVPSRISTLASEPAVPEPPVTRIRPSGSRAAEAPARASAMSPIGAHVPLGTWGLSPLSQTPEHRTTAATQDTDLLILCMAFNL
jgi:hypothetical protein